MSRYLHGAVVYALDFETEGSVFDSVATQKHFESVDFFLNFNNI